mgnify:CR=1 FL=1
MTGKLLSVLLIYFFSLTICSCEIINPAEPVPAYIHVDNIALHTDTNTQGSSSSKIVDVWLYADNDPLGPYEMPATIPVLKEGTHIIKARGGIIVNGISATRVYYPFYTFFDTTVTLTLGSVLKINPVVTYFSDVIFSLNEKFSGAGISISTTSQSDTSLQIVTDSADAFENETAKVYLDSQHPVFECSSNSQLNLPVDGTAVYMELNYKTNTEFSVGIFAITSSQVITIPVLNLRPSSEWKKVYVYLSDAATSVQSALGFKPYIHMDRNSSIGDAELYFDNVKVLHY